MVEATDVYKGQESYATQSDTVMFAPSVDEQKQNERPRRRTFEEIRAENRKHRVQTSQDHSHTTDDDSRGLLIVLRTCNPIFYVVCLFSG